MELSDESSRNVDCLHHFLFKEFPFLPDRRDARIFTVAEGFGFPCVLVNQSLQR